MSFNDGVTSAFDGLCSGCDILMDRLTGQLSVSQKFCYGTQKTEGFTKVILEDLKFTI
jgi:hypothetical protein